MSKEGEKIIIKFYLNNNPYISKKLEKNNELSKIRKLLNNLDEEICFSFKDGFKIDKEEEPNYTLSDILDNNNVYLIKSDNEKENNKTKKIVNEQLEQLKLDCKKLDNIGDLEVYLYNKIDFSKEEKEKSINIMVVGQTGSGKTTLLNAFLNYLLGVQFEDNFRFKLIYEDFGESTYNSMTREVMSYNIRPLIGNIPLITVIDTPGFGDTGGIEKDKRIPDKISKKFKNISHLNAICFVVQSTNSRLTINQKYIFNSIMDLFSEDIKENFIAMLTFCNIIDDNPVILEPLKAEGSGFDLVLPAIEKTQWYFLFDNLAVFKTKENIKMNKKIKSFYGFAMENFDEFMKKLISLPKKNTKKTKNVIDHRKFLESRIKILEEIVRKCLKKMDEFYQIYNIIMQYYDELKNRNFTYTVNEIKYRKCYDISKYPGSGGKFFTTCLICSRTCHFGCYIAKNNEKDECSAMGDDGQCKLCPNKCNWKDHENRNYIWEEYEEIVEKTDEELKKKYVKKSSEKSKKEQILEGLEKDLVKENSELITIQEEMKDTINELKRIAINKNVFENAEQHIDLLIENEKYEQKPGYLKRIEAYNILKKQKKKLREIYNGEYPDTKKINEFVKKFDREELKKQIRTPGCCNIF